MTTDLDFLSDFDEDTEDAKPVAKKEKAVKTETKPVVSEADALEARKAKFLAAQEKAAQKAAERAAARAERQSRNKQNGIPQPREGSTGAIVWAALDKLAKTVDPATINYAMIRDEMNDQYVFETEGRGALNRWRKYNGLPPRKAGRPKAAEV
ncbi:MAG: hypothetical protein HXP18_01780 [Veillonella sp.]|nr:hypothetical protein [Veillonella sp.]